MSLKRLSPESDEERSGPPTKCSCSSKKKSRKRRSERFTQAFNSFLEPWLRKIVGEEVDRAVDKNFGSSSSRQADHSPSLELQFSNDLPETLFTGNKLLSRDMERPLRITLCDAKSGAIVTSGPLSSAKVNLVVLDGDFVLDDQDDLSKKNFDAKTIRNREGKRPLLTGPLMISLHNGEGYICEVSFTDNSKCTRSGKFRLGVKLFSRSDDEVLHVREGVSNAFKVKDHRGEAYQKHYPPSLDDEVWRLDKIAQNGSYCKKLSENKILCVRDFLRAYVKDEQSLRSVILGGIKKKAWHKLIEHAKTCVIDDKIYVYKTACGFSLLLNSIYRVIGVSCDGHNYLSVENLDAQQMNIIEDLKKQAYRNSAEIAPLSEPSNIDSLMPLLENPTTDNRINPSFGLEGLSFQAENDNPQMQINADQNKFIMSSFELGETSTPIHGPHDPTYGFDDLFM